MTKIEYKIGDVSGKTDASIDNHDPAGNNMFKVNNRNTRTRCGICSKLTIKIPERRFENF